MVLGCDPEDSGGSAGELRKQSNILFEGGVRVAYGRDVEGKIAPGQVYEELGNSNGLVFLHFAS